MVESASTDEGSQFDDADWFARQKASAARPPWWVWNASIHTWGRAAVGLVGRLQITGSIAPKLLRGPLLLAPNHIGNFDAIALTVAMGQIGLRPRFLVTAGIMRAPVVGPFMQRSGNLRVNRGRADAGRSMELVAVALEHGGHLCVYPEGRVGLDPDFWPEKAKTGLARIALQHSTPVIPVAQWGAHEVIKYEGGPQMRSSALSSVWRQPALRVHFGRPVPLSDLDARAPGHPLRAHRRIMGALTRDLRELRGREVGPPHFLDETRPIGAHSLAAFPGGLVPESLP